MLLGSGDAVAFVDNHDTQRNGRARLTYKNGSAYALAEAFMLAWPYGAPQVMSSFTFTNPEPGRRPRPTAPPTRSTCGSGWECEHRWRTTANMVGLRNAAAGAGGHQLVDQRQRPDRLRPRQRRLRRVQPRRRRADPHLPDQPAGRHLLRRDERRLHRRHRAPARRTTVNGSGQVTATVPANGALALHINARTSAPSPDHARRRTCTSVAATFEVNATDRLRARTSTWSATPPALGNWNPAAAVALTAAAYPVWRATATLPVGTAFQYKYIKKNGTPGDLGERPEPHPDHAVLAPCTATWTDSWR